MAVIKRVLAILLRNADSTRSLLQRQPSAQNPPVISFDNNQSADSARSHANIFPVRPKPVAFICYQNNIVRRAQARTFLQKFHGMHTIPPAACIAANNHAAILTGPPTRFPTGYAFDVARFSPQSDRTTVAIAECTRCTCNASREMAPER